MTTIMETDVKDDRLLFCYKCKQFNLEDCKLHPLTVLPDRKRKFSGISNAYASLPKGLKIKTSKIPSAGLGVFAKRDIPAGVRFGPYKGKMVERRKILKDGDTSYCWELVKNGIQYCIDGEDENKSNWMRFVNCARWEDEQNVIGFQYRGNIYYRTYKPIPRKTEMLVYYGDEFAQKLGILSSDQLILKPFQCKDCEKAFSRRDSLVNHMHNHSLTGELALKCEFCKTLFSRWSSLRRHIRFRCQFTKQRLRQVGNAQGQPVCVQ